MTCPTNAINQTRHRRSCRRVWRELGRSFAHVIWTVGISTDAADHAVRVSVENPNHKATRPRPRTGPGGRHVAALSYCDTFCLHGMIDE